MENAKKFFEEVLRTEEAKAILADTKKPETEPELLDAYLEIAKKLNVELTAEGILAYFKTAVVSAEVDDEELAQLTGGEGDTCADTYTSGENCWWEDGCDVFWTSYDSYDCGSTAETKRDFVEAFIS